MLSIQIFSVVEIFSLENFNFSDLKISPFIRILVFINIYFLNCGIRKSGSNFSTLLWNVVLIKEKILVMCVFNYFHEFLTLYDDVIITAEILKIDPSNEKSIRYKC